MTMRALTNGTIRLLPLTVEHAAEYIRLVNEPSIAPHVNSPEPFTLQHFTDLLTSMQIAAAHYSWMIERDGTMVGSINAADHQGVKRFQGGYWLAPEHRGKGIARAGLALVRDFLFEECGAIRVQALVEPENLASQAVVEACGYAREGRLRRFYPDRTRGLIDVFMYAIVRPIT